MLRFLLSFFLIGLSAYAYATKDQSLSITLDKQALQLNYTQPTRITTILNDYYTNTDGDFYLLGAVLSDDDKQNNITLEQSQLIDELSLLGHWN